MGQLKEWKSRLKKLRNLIKREKKQIEQISTELDTHSNSAKKLESKISDLNSREIKLSPHAVARFSERVKSGLPLPEISRYILCHNLYDLVNTLGDGKYFLNLEGLNKKVTVVVEDRVIKTLWLTK